MKRNSKALTVAIIIPAYNEEHRIAACLEAIARQTDKPDEVILVDNNCTDDTVKIARKFPFVRIVKEPSQGKVSARDRGFNMAKSDILGRIDVDSEIAPNWVAQVKRSFTDHPDVVGITGPGHNPLMLRLRRPTTLIWSKLYFFWTKMFFRVPVLWGANMAIRANAWQKVRHQVCLDEHLVHEDQDISLLLRAHAGRLLYDDKLRMTSYSQSYHYFPKLVTYTVMRHTGRDYHRNKGTFDDMPYEVPRWISFVMYTIFWPGLLVFFTASFLAWPLDLVMKILGRQQRWLS